MDNVALLSLSLVIETAEFGCRVDGYWSGARAEPQSYDATNPTVRSFSRRPTAACTVDLPYLFSFSPSSSALLHDAIVIAYAADPLQVGRFTHMRGTNHEYHLGWAGSSALMRWQLPGPGSGIYR